MSGPAFQTEGQLGRRRVNVRCVKQCRSDCDRLPDSDDLCTHSPDGIIIHRLHLDRNCCIEGQRGGVVIFDFDGKTDVLRVYLIRGNMVDSQQAFVVGGQGKTSIHLGLGDDRAVVLQNCSSDRWQGKNLNGQVGSVGGLRVAEGRIGEDRHSGGTFVQGQINRSAAGCLGPGYVRGGIKRRDGETNRNKRCRTTDNAAGAVTQTDGETVRNSRTAGRSGVHHHSARNQVGVGEGRTDGNRSAANRQAACGRRWQGLQAEYQLVVDIVGVDHGQDGGSYV